MSTAAFAPFIPSGVQSFGSLDKATLTGVRPFAGMPAPSPDEEEPQRNPVLDQFWQGFNSLAQSLAEDYETTGRVLTESIPEPLRERGYADFLGYIPIEEMYEVESLRDKSREAFHRWRAGEISQEEYSRIAKESQLASSAMDVRRERMGEEARKFRESGLSPADYARQLWYERHAENWRDDGGSVSIVGPAPLRGMMQGASRAGGSMVSILGRYIPGIDSDEINREINKADELQELADQVKGGEATSVVREIFASLFEMAPAAAGGFPTLAAYFGAAATNRGYTIGIDKDLSPIDATLYGVRNGAIEVAVMASFAKLAKPFGGTAEESLAAIFGRGSAKSVAAKTGLSRTLLAAVSEGTEEVTTELLQAVNDRFSGIDDGALQWRNLYPRLRRAGLVGAGAGATTSAAAFATQANQVAESIENLQTLDAARGFLAGLDHEGEAPATSRRGFAAATGEKDTSEEYRRGYVNGVLAKQERAKEGVATADPVDPESQAEEPTATEEGSTIEEEPTAADPSLASEAYYRMAGLAFANPESEHYQPLEVARLEEIIQTHPEHVEDILDYARQLEAEDRQLKRDRRDLVIERLKLSEQGFRALQRKARKIESKGGDPGSLEGFDELLARYNLATGVESGGRDTSGPDLEAELWETLLADPDAKTERWEFLGRAIDDYLEAQSYDPASGPAAENDPGYYDQADQDEGGGDTRGQGVQYHGARGPIDSLAPGHYQGANIYGGMDTFYTTDAMDVAAGYGRRQGDARVYRVAEKQPVKLFDMDQPVPASDLRDLFGGDGAMDIVDDSLRNLGSDTLTLRQLMDDIRDYSPQYSYSMDTVQEIFDTAIANLSRQGFGGMTHRGGDRTGTKPHTVKIYFDPANQLDLSDVTPSKRGPSTLEDAPDKTGQQPRPKPVPGPSAATGQFAQTPATEIAVSGFPLGTLVGVPPVDGIRMMREIGTIIKAADLPAGVRGRATIGGKGIVEVARQLGADSPQFRKTLMHEIGHVLDMLPDGEIKRGNLLGRMASLLGYRSGLLITPPGSPVPVIKDKEIRAELKDVSFWWRPMAPEASESHKQYRNSGVELYADAMSVFLNAPGELQQRAPKFFQGLLLYIKNKPEVAAAYIELQEALQGAPEKLRKARREARRGNWKQGDELLAMQAHEQELAKRSVWEAMMQDGLAHALAASRATSQAVRILAVDKASASLDAAKRQGRKNIYTGLLQLKAELERFARLDADSQGMLERIQENVHRPLRESGLSDEDLGDVLFFKRVVARDEVLNPDGYLPEDAAEELASLDDDLGTDKAAALRSIEKAFRDEALDAVREATESGLFSLRMFTETMEPNADNYAHFAVLHHLESKIGWEALQVKGTLDPVANPYRSTIIKLVAIRRAAALNRAKQVVLGRLMQDDPSMIRPRAKDDKSSVPLGMSTVRMYVDGVPQLFDVDSSVALLFSDPTHPVVSLMANFGRKVSRGVATIWHPLLVSWSFSFAGRNLVRDPARTYVLLGAAIDKKRRDMYKRLANSHRAAGQEVDSRALWQQVDEAIPPLTLRELVADMWANRQAAKRRAHEQFDEKVNELLSSGMLDVFYTDRSRMESRGFMDNDATNALLNDLGVLPDGMIGKVGRMAEGVLDRYLPEWLANMRSAAYEWSPPFIINTQETMGKLGAYDALKRRGFNTDEIVYMLHNFVSTPNTRFRGIAADYQNAASMYTTVRLSNLRAHIELMKANPIGYYKRTAVTILPNVFWTVATSQLARMGGFGTAIAMVMQAIPEDEEDRNIVVPLFMFIDEDGRLKPVYLAIPHDQTHVFWSTLARRIVKAPSEGFDSASTFADLRTEVLGTWSPPFEIAGRWMDYASGRMPQDTYFNRRDIMSRDEFAEHRMGLPRMGMWTASKMGVAGDAVEMMLGTSTPRALHAQPDTTAEFLTRNSLYLAPFIKISGRSFSEDEWNEAQAADALTSRTNNLIQRTDRNTRRLASEFIRRQNKRAEHKTDEDRAFLDERRFWYYSVYRKYHERIKKEIDMGQRERASAIAEELAEITTLYHNKWAAASLGNSQKAEELEAELMRRLRGG